MIRRPGESVRIHGEIRVMFDFIKGDQASVRVEVPRGMSVDKEEDYLRKKEANVQK